MTSSRLASVVFYCIRRETLPCLSDFLHLQPEATDKTFGQFWVCQWQSNIVRAFTLIQFGWLNQTVFFFSLYLYIFLGVVDQWKTAGCVWDEAAHWISAYWTSGQSLMCLNNRSAQHGLSYFCVSVSLCYTSDKRNWSFLGSAEWFQSNSVFSQSQSLSDYTKWLSHYSTKQQNSAAKPITCRSYARYVWDSLRK